MKIKHEYPEQGARRNVRKFLWLPLTLGCETRWLETASWTEVYVKPSPVEKGHWVPTVWFAYHQIV